MNKILSIKTIKETYGEEKCPCGQITIDDFKEKFVMPTDYWTIKDYERQWKEGLERIKIHDKSCLITTVHDPQLCPLVEMWGLYKNGNKIVIRNYMFFEVFYNKIIGTQPFTPDTCYNFIPELSKSTTASEWVIDADSI